MANLVEPIELDEISEHWANIIRRKNKIYWYRRRPMVPHRCMTIWSVNTAGQVCIYRKTSSITYARRLENSWLDNRARIFADAP
jgi:hypothetical protein